MIIVQTFKFSLYFHDVRFVLPNSAMLASFVGYGVGQFTTSFLIRTHGLSIQMASLLFGIILGLRLM